MKLEGQTRIRAAFRRAEPTQACAKRRLHLLPFSPQQRPGGAARAPVQGQTSGQTAGQIAWSVLQVQW